jgi:hypothetical protein
VSSRRDSGCGCDIDLARGLEVSPRRSDTREDAWSAARLCVVVKIRRARPLYRSEEDKPPDSIEIAKHTLLSCGFILKIGALSPVPGRKNRIPDVVVFVVAGMLIGPQAPAVGILAGAAAVLPRRSVGCGRYLRSDRSNLAIRLEVSQREPPIFCTSE